MASVTSSDLKSHPGKAQDIITIFATAEIAYPNYGTGKLRFDHEEIRLIFDVQLCYTKMIESLSESSTDDK